MVAIYLRKADASIFRSWRQCNEGGAAAGAFALGTPPCGERPVAPAPRTTALTLPVACGPLRAWTLPLMQAFRKARCVKRIRVSRRLRRPRDGDTRTGPQDARSKHARNAAGLPVTVCLCPPYVLAPGIQRKRPRETLQSAADTRQNSFFVSNAQAVRAIGKVTSFRGLVASVAAASFCQPNNRHAADAPPHYPWPSLALPPELSSLGVRQAARPRPEFSGAKAAEAVRPRPAPLRVLVLRHPVPRRSSCSGSAPAAVSSGGTTSSSFLNALGSHETELRDREAGSAAAGLRTYHPLPFLGLHGDESSARLR